MVDRYAAKTAIKICDHLFFQGWPFIPISEKLRGRQLLIITAQSPLHASSNEANVQGGLFFMFLAA